MRLAQLVVVHCWDSFISSCSWSSIKSNKNSLMISGDCGQFGHHIHSFLRITYHNFEKLLGGYASWNQSSFTFWCMVQTHTDRVPAAKAKTHHFGCREANFENPIFTSEYFTLNALNISFTLHKKTISFPCKHSCQN